MKPDIVAVGKTVLSAGARPDQVGECDPSRIPGPGWQQDLAAPGRDLDPASQARRRSRDRLAPGPIAP